MYSTLKFTSFVLSLLVALSSLIECISCSDLHKAGRDNHLGGFELRHSIPFEDAFITAREKPRWSEVVPGGSGSRSSSPSSAQQPSSAAAARERSSNPSASTSAATSAARVSRAASPVGLRQFEPYTTFVPGFYGEIDHVFYDSRRLRCDRWIPTPPHAAVLDHVALPNVQFPSDHLALVCELSYK